MKKLLCILAAAAVAGWLGLLPFQATDVARLIPTQTVFVQKDGTQYTVDVGAGVKGTGSDLKTALSALQEQTAGTVYFDTCGQVLLAGDTAALLPEIAAEEAFRPAADVYTVSAEPAIDRVSDYLNSHHGGVTVSDLRAALAEEMPLRVPVLTEAGGGYRIVA